MRKKRKTRLSHEYSVLEDRCMLAGVTIITHGWQNPLPIIGSNGPGEDAPGWAIEMGTSVLERAGGNGSIFLHDTRPDEATFGEWVPLNDFNTGQNWPNSNSPNDEVVLVYNWIWDSADGEDGWLEAASDNLFASLVEVQSDARFGSLVGQNFANLALNGDVFDFHFIGHSRGAVLNSLVVSRFGYYFPNHEIDQVTTLDPHPIVVGGVGLLFYESNDPSILTYDNVHYAVSSGAQNQPVKGA